MPLIRWVLIAICLMVIFPQIGLACSHENTNSIFNWARCWCLPRFIIWIIASVVIFFVSHTWLFPYLLEQDRPNRIWPKTAMGWTLAIGWFGVCLTFVAIFGWISDELRPTPKGSSGLIPGFPGLDSHIVWIGILMIVGLGGSFMITRLLRSRRGSSNA